MKESWRKILQMRVTKYHFLITSIADLLLLSFDLLQSLHVSALLTVFRLH